MRFFLTLSYDGSAFHGWQRQPDDLSVQQTLEEALSTILRRETPVTGAGRTDAGVHARRMIAHFDSDERLPDKKRLLYGLNRLTGHSISVIDIREVGEESHARFDATERTYKYFVSYEKCPFLLDYSWHSPSSLDTEAMNAASRILTETDDFTSFAKLHSDAKTNICRVKRAVWEKWENMYGVPGLVFTISADRFLRNMVRAVVGTLVDVGRHKLSTTDMRNIIKQKDRCAAGTSMPPQGLFLWEIKYPF